MMLRANGSLSCDGTLALRAAAPAITVDDQGGRRLWIGPDATYWQRELLQRQRPPCRACLLSSRAKEELASSMKGAQFASTMRRPVPASRCYCFRAEGWSRLFRSFTVTLS